MSSENSTCVISGESNERRNYLKITNAPTIHDDHAQTDKMVRTHPENGTRKISPQCLRLGPARSIRPCQTRSWGATENVDESNRRRLCTKQSIVHQIAGESSNRVKECLQQFRRTALHRITKQITLLVLFVFVANSAFISYLELKC